MLSDSERRAIFAANPMVEGFLSTALQDLQYNENDDACIASREPHDVGTIWSCPDATFRAAERECINFAKAAGPTIERIQHADYESLGSNLYLERAGHGAGFADRSYYSEDRDESRAIGEALSGSVEPRGMLEMYVGDDGRAWIVGGERES